jgi:hypothetical protein
MSLTRRRLVGNARPLTAAGQIKVAGAETNGLTIAPEYGASNSVPLKIHLISLLKNDEDF